MLVFARRQYRMTFDDPEALMSMQWPATLNAAAHLAPGYTFGEGVVPPGPLLGPSGGQVKASFNVYEGVVRGTGGAQLPRAEVQVPFYDGYLDLSGPVASITCSVADGDHLVHVMSGLWKLLQDYLVALLQLPCTIVDTKGTLAGKRFSVLPEIEPARMRFVSQNTVPEALKAAARAIESDDSPSRSRLNAALAYAGQIARLRMAQDDQRDFAAEISLCMAKAIEVLFGSADTFRKQANRIGFDSTKAELIVSMSYLRSTVDVAHPTTARLSPDERRLAVALIDRAEGLLGEFLTLLIDAVQSGVLEFAEPTEKDRLQREKARAQFFSSVAKLLPNVPPPTNSNK